MTCFGVNIPYDGDNTGVRATISTTATLDEEKKDRSCDGDDVSNAAKNQSLISTDLNAARSWSLIPTALNATRDLQCIHQL